MWLVGLLGPVIGVVVCDWEWRWMMCWTLGHWENENVVLMCEIVGGRRLSLCSSCVE